MLLYLFKTSLSPVKHALFWHCFFAEWSFSQILHKKKHKKSDLFANTHTDNNHHFWTHVLRPGETKVNLFGHNARCYVWRKNKDTCTILPLKFGSGSIMVLGYCAAGGTTSQKLYNTVRLYQGADEFNFISSVTIDLLSFDSC